MKLEKAYLTELNSNWLNIRNTSKSILCPIYNPLVPKSSISSFSNILTFIYEINKTAWRHHGTNDLKLSGINSINK